MSYTHSSRLLAEQTLPALARCHSGGHNIAGFPSGLLAQTELAKAETVERNELLVPTSVYECACLAEVSRYIQDVKSTQRKFPAMSSFCVSLASPGGQGFNVAILVRLSCTQQTKHVPSAVHLELMHSPTPRQALSLPTLVFTAFLTLRARGTLRKLQFAPQEIMFYYAMVWLVCTLFALRFFAQARTLK